MYVRVSMWAYVCGCQVSPSTMWILETELRSSSLAARTFTRWAISTALSRHFILTQEIKVLVFISESEHRKHFATSVCAVDFGHEICLALSNLLEPNSTWHLWLLLWVYWDPSLQLTTNLKVRNRAHLLTSGTDLAFLQGLMPTTICISLLCDWYIQTSIRPLHSCVCTWTKPWALSKSKWAKVPPPGPL